MLTPQTAAVAEAATGEAGHFVQFYAEDDFIVDEVADFLDGALRAGDAAILIATPEHRAQIARQLKGFGDVAGSSPWFPGELITLDARETLAKFMVKGTPDPALFLASVGAVMARAANGGTRAVRAFGEMVALLCADGNPDAAIRLEELWNGLAQRHTFSLLCAYPMNLFASADHAEAFRHICAAHSRVQPAGGFSTLADPAELALTVAALQQKAIALQTEVARRSAAEQTLRRREKELSDFLENAAEGLHRVSADGTILWANRAELEMLGYRADEYVGHNVADFYVEPQQITGILGRLAAGETLHDEPATLRCKNGSRKHVQITSNAYFENGELVYTRCFTRDVSERHALEQANSERSKLFENLQAASRAKDEFLAMLGHELRNPLSPIVTALQLMKMRGDLQSSKEQAIIQRQVEHLIRLVDDLLDVSRITRGKVELRTELVEIGQVLARAVEMASVLFEQRRHQLSIDVASAGLLWRGDPTRLAQVVANLLTNAARYTDPGGNISLRATHEADQTLRISVRDNGRGLSAELLPRVFELFFQGHRGVDRAEGGLGIGLALVKNLVELHGGTVEAKSDGPGCGSEFIVRLPLVPQRSRDAADLEATGGRPGDNVGRRILVVDDNADAAEMVAMLLRTDGHQVVIAHDPVAALGVIGSFVPEVALLDIGLPVMDGYELAGRLREQTASRCRFIALTGYGQDGDRERSVAAGFEGHLVKPVDGGVLLDVVNKLSATLH